VRRAFTLVEAILAFSIGSVLLVTIWNIFSGAQRRSQEAERRLTAVAAMQVLMQTLERDLSQLVPDRSIAGMNVVDLDPKGHRLKLLVSTEDRKRPMGEGRLAFVQRTIEFDVASHKVLRGDGGSVSPLSSARFRDVKFTLTGPLDLAAPLSNPLPAADCLVVRAEWVPSEDIVAQRVTQPKDVVVFDMVFGLDHLSDGTRFPGWVINPTSRAVLETRAR
jgi:hypothetical protein